MTRGSPPELILASGSAARRMMLEAAGLSFRIMPADVDEPGLRHSMIASDPDVTPSTIARALARAKSEEVSRRHPAALVIGADQVLEVGRAVIAKPADLTAARRQLRELSGRMHRLLSAVSLAQEGLEVWSDFDAASLSMRDFSDAFLDDYIARAGERICASVGGYELEGLGIQLFESMEGDYFTILGLPLLTLLEELRARGALMT